MPVWMRIRGLEQMKAAFQIRVSSSRGSKKKAVSTVLPTVLPAFLPGLLDHLGRQKWVVSYRHCQHAHRDPP